MDAETKRRRDEWDLFLDELVDDRDPTDPFWQAVADYDEALTVEVMKRLPAKSADKES